MSTPAQNQSPSPNDPPLLLRNHTDDVAGLRELILDNAVLVFPHIVQDHLERVGGGPETGAFKVAVVPRYTKVSGTHKIKKVSYRAFLASRQPNRRYHVQIAEGRDMPNIARALQSLLVILRACLTFGQIAHRLFPRSTGAETGYPFDEEFGNVDGTELSEGMNYRDPRHEVMWTRPGFPVEEPGARREGSERGHRDDVHLSRGRVRTLF